jgi:predicted dehydrogenase
LSRAALGLAVEDSASVMLRSASGVVGTIEIGSTFPGNGTDADWKLAGRDGFLRSDGSALRLATAGAEEVTPAEPLEPVARVAVREALEHWRRGASAPIGARDCARVASLIDAAYAMAT